MTDALAEVLPEVARRVPRVSLGLWPTPVEPLGIGERLWAKREDRSSPIYGGNKVRPLETVLARALDDGVGTVWATGAWGSNQALATALHAPRLGLRAGALLFPQPPSPPAAENLSALLSTGAEVHLLPTIGFFPFAALRLGLAGARSRPREVVVAPGSATPLGALGHVSAALEVAQLAAQGGIPTPRHVVLPVGSTCTAAGLLVGFALAARLGLGFPDGPPLVHAVRISPWPVTSRSRIVGLARRTAALLLEKGGPDVTSAAALSRGLRISGRYLGSGYGRPTRAASEAVRRFDLAGGPTLDTTYSAKAAAFLLDRAEQLDGPIVFWSTRSTAPLPPVSPEAVAAAPRSVRRWLTRSRA